MNEIKTKWKIPIKFPGRVILASNIGLCGGPDVKYCGSIG